MKDRVTVFLVLLLVIILGIGGLMFFDPMGTHHFLGELHGALQEVATKLWIALQIVFCVALILSVAAILVRLNHARKIQVIGPNKYGPSQAIVKPDGDVVLLSEMPANDLLETLRKSLQTNATTATLLNKKFAITEEKTVDADQPRMDRPALPEPREDDILNISPDFRPHADQVLGKRKLFVGVSGSGKSNSTAVYVEELGKFGVPMLLADTEDEYGPLCDSRWLPNGALAGASGGQYAVTVDNASAFGRHLVEHNLQVILNLQSYEMEEGGLILAKIIDGLREWEQERANEVRIPCEVILEEATTWLPQNIKESPLYGKGALAQLHNAFFNDLVRKGRKRGLGLTAVCQKIAEIDKRALQCDVKLLHRQTELGDLERYAKWGITNEETLSLADGEAFIFSGSVSKMRTQVRRRLSKHGADTPGLEQLRRYQQGRNYAESRPEFGRNFGEIPEIPEVVRNRFEADTEPFRTISEIRRTGPLAPKSPYEGIPENMVSVIEGTYEGLGYKDRTKIRDILGLNGDQYWWIRVVCDQMDLKRQDGESPVNVRRITGI